MLAPGTSLADQAESGLRKDIIVGIWPPKARLPLDDLKRHYGMGSSPLREALSRLMGEGLVRIQNNRGFRVADLSRKDLEEIEWMRVAVECAALRDSIARGGREWEGRIVGALHRLTVATQTTATDRVSLDLWNDEHDAFHAALIACCGNTRALALQRRLADQHRRYRIALMGENMLRDEIVEEHRGVADAALKRDVETAVRLLAQNMKVTTNFYAGVLRERLAADV
jgi:GntR family carbon starvation induced transcriptional regulator